MPITTFLRNRRRTMLARAVPKQLLNSGGVGYWYEPRPGYVFKDTAATQHASTDGDSVGYLQDLSGNARHATQAVFGSRPLLGFEPAAGVRNLALRTELFTDATVWTNFNFTPVRTTLSNYVDGTLVSAAEHLYAVYDQSNGAFITAETAYAPTEALQRLAHTFTTPAGCTQVRIYPLRSAAGASYAYQVVTVTAATQYTFSFYFEDGKVGGVQLELGATATNYQRVRSVLGVTESGQQTNYFLKFDGSDDRLITSLTQAWGTDALTIVAGVRAATAAGTSVLLEFSPSSSANVGAWGMFAPLSGKYTGRSRGVSASVDVSGPGFTAPSLDVLTYTAKMGTPVATLRRNGAQVATSGSGYGGGNYGTYDLYLGARSGGSLAFNGRIYGLVILPGIASAENITRLEAYMANLCGKVF